MSTKIMKHPGRSKGVVLAGALILLVSLTLIAVTVAYRTSMNELIAANQRDALNAMAIAESGLESGFAAVKTVVEANGDSLPQSFCDTYLEPTMLDSQKKLAYSSDISDGSFAVWVTECLEGGANVGGATMHSIGMVNGAERELEVVMGIEDTTSPGAGTSNYSFLANDYISLTGLYFVGPLVHIHTFGEVKADGKQETCVIWSDCPNIATAPTGYVTAKTYDPATFKLLTDSDSPWDLNGPNFEGVGGPNPEDNPYDIYADFGIDPNASQEAKDAALLAAAKDTIPHIYPPTYREFATIELSADCVVSAGKANTEYAEGTVIHDVSADGAWNNWTCSSQSAWSVNSEGTPFDAFYYVHGNVKAKGDGAKQSGVWNATFVATGSFESGCCPSFGTWNQPTGNSDADNIFLLVGNDVIIQSAPEQTIEGIIAAHREVKLDGSQSHYKGTVIAENGLHHDYVNFPDSDQEVVDDPDNGIDVQNELNRADYNVINSNTILEGTGVGLGGGATVSGAPVLTAKAWRERIK